MKTEISKILAKTKYKYSLNFRKEKGKEIVCDAIHVVDVPKASEILSEMMKDHAIQFLDSIKDYEHESGKAIYYDDRETEELYQIFLLKP